MRRNEFATYVAEDLLGHIDGVYLRAMFSGFGLYKEGIMAGLVIDDELYLKVDDSNKAEYEEMGSVPFSYERKDGKVIALSFWRVPFNVLEDREKLERLFDLSYTINLKKSNFLGRNN